MEYSIYKLEFQTGVHFGTGMLNESAYTFQADQLFSALYIEGLKIGKADEFYQLADNGTLLFSDAFPYINHQYLVPKPMVYVKHSDRGISKQKKLYKRMKYIPIELVDDFVNGTVEFNKDPMENYGAFVQQTMANVRREDETLPFRVGTFYYQDGCGLYIIVGYENDDAKTLLEELLESLSYTGIGGKKSSGMGRFVLKYAKMSEKLLAHLKKRSSRQMLLSVALPKDEELENALDLASYQLVKRSGFVASDKYADEWQKKKDLYVFAAGSCFEKRFSGDIYDVSRNGKHAVYRYAKGIFMGV